MAWGPVPEAAAQTATLSISGPADANEGDMGRRELTYTVSLSKQISADVIWQVCFSGTATRDMTGTVILPANSDYQVRQGSGNLPFLSSDCSFTYQLGPNASVTLSNTEIKIRVKGDTDPESDETVVATLSILGSPPSDVTLGTSVHTHTILDDDTAVAAGVTITQSGSGTSVAENSGTDTYTVVLDSKPTHNVTVTATSGSPGAATVKKQNGSAGTSTTLTFTPTTWSAAQTITVTGVNDDVDNTDNSRTATISHSSSSTDSNYNNLSISSVTATVSDDDMAGVTVSQSARSVSENGGTATYTVVLDTEPVGRVIITATAGGAALVDGPGGNATPKATAALTFTTNTWSAPQTVTITGQNDNIVNPGGERTRTITHTIKSGDGDGSRYRPNLISIPSVTATVTDDDNSAPTAIALSVNDNNVDEGDGAQTITVTATVGGSGRFAAAQTVAASVAGSGASNVVGFTASPSTFNIPIAAGAQTGTGTFTLTPTDNSADEADETITVSGTLSGVTVSSATITLTDDDATAPPPPPPTTPVLTISGGSAVTEGGNASFTISSNPAPSGSVTASYTVTQSGQFVAAGQLGGGKTQNVSSASTTFTIPTVPDNVDEPNGSVTVTLNTGQGYTVGSRNAATVAVHDDDDSGGGGGGGGGGGSENILITLSVSPNPVYEGNRAIVTVTLSKAVPSAVTIPIVVTAGSAEAEDYGALASVVIKANEPQGRGAIATVQDDDMDDETFTVTFGAVPAEFTRGTPSSIEVIITEDENAEVTGSFDDEIPAAFALGQNYPNPFNPSTAIEYDLARPDYVRLEVFDAQGRSVGVLVDGVRPAGTHSVRFDATGLPSGLYVYWLQAGGETLTRKMTLVK